MDHLATFSDVPRLSVRHLTVEAWLGQVVLGIYDTSCDVDIDVVLSADDVRSLRMVLQAQERV